MRGIMLVIITRKIVSKSSLIVEPFSLKEKWHIPRQTNDSFSKVYGMEQLR